MRDELGLNGVVEAHGVDLGDEPVCVVGVILKEDKVMMRGKMKMSTRTRMRMRMMERERMMKRTRKMKRIVRVTGDNGR